MPLELSALKIALAMRSVDHVSSRPSLFIICLGMLRRPPWGHITLNFQLVFKRQIVLGYAEIGFGEAGNPRGAEIECLWFCLGQLEYFFEVGFGCDLGNGVAGQGGVLGVWSLDVHGKSVCQFVLDQVFDDIGSSEERRVGKEGRL